MTSRTVIVTDGNQRAALALVRSLGSAGFRCVVAAPIRRSIAGVSRYAALEVETPDPLTAPDEFVDAIATLAKAQSAALIVPIAEPSMLALLPRRERLSP